MKKIVLIGYGKIASHHLRVLRALKHDVIASCNRSDSGNMLAKSDGEIKRTYSDYMQMINEINPDGIIVSVSFENIYGVTKDIIPFGIPILLEKPSGLSLNEHKSLVNLAKEHKTPVQIGLNRRHYSIYHSMMDFLKNNKGKINSILVEWSENPLHLIKSGVKVKDLPKIIFANSIHGIDLMRQFTGPIENFNIQTQILGEPARWIINVSGESEKGVIFNFNSSWDNPVPWRVSLYGANKRFLLKPLEKCTYIKNVGDPEIEIKPKWYDLKYKAGFYKQMRGYLNLLNGKENICEIESATNSVEIAQKIFNKIK